MLPTIMQITTTHQQTVNRLANIKALVCEDLVAIDSLICEELVSDITLIQEVTRHIIKSGGKRLRPLLVVLCAKALGYAGKEHHELAVIIEFVHTATLLHDDVVDESGLRRGQQTANAIWGNQASVLVGDFLYSRAFQLLAKRSNVPVMKVLADTTNAIAEGEVQQLMNRHDPDISERQYLQVIYSKTAKLFESAAEIGAIVAGNLTQQRALASYGLNLGLAFQIIDDLLDYTASSKEMGKNIGDDLAEGKITLPLIYTLKHTPPPIANTIKEAIKQGGLSQLNTILDAIHNSRAIDYCKNKALHHAQLAKTAIQHLSQNEFSNAMTELVEFVIDRHF